MVQTEVQYWAKRLHSHAPLLGTGRRRRACAHFAQVADADAVPYLLEALSDRDAQVRETAECALRDLRDTGAVDALCAIWAKSRDEVLERIIEECGYVAMQPVEVRVLSALKVNQGSSVIGDESVLEAFVAAARDTDPLLVQRAYVTLRTLGNPEAQAALCRLATQEPAGLAAKICIEAGYRPSDPEEAILFLYSIATRDSDPDLAQRAHAMLCALDAPKLRAALCRLATRDPAGLAATICIEAGYRPSDPEEVSLFLFVTRQLDAYFKEDYEFQNLRLAYERADATVQAQVMEIVRSGDRRCLGFFGSHKPLCECSDDEITLAIESGLRHKDWPRLFEAFLQLPLKYGFRLLAHFRASGWEPDKDDQRKLYKQLLQDSQGRKLRDVRKGDATSPLFEQWLARPVSGSAEQLRRVTPMEGVSIVAELARQGGTGADTAEAIRSSPHWLIRLAGHATGLCPHPSLEKVEDDNFWLEELVTSHALLEFWPDQATPADLEALQSAPHEAWIGRYSAVRRVLKGIMTYWVTTPVFDDVEIESGDSPVEFGDAGKS
ncbi:MAG: HEAT repeat domain-containing protein [Candidatus Hydrogenedens sp.]|jgi:hypothetical protein|nr:HEAT repeat domain-containing protein [Candidatus Hydrogenedens sp.]